MLIADWLAAAKADAVKRGCRSSSRCSRRLAASTAALRGADEARSRTGRARPAAAAGPLTMPRSADDQRHRAARAGRRVSPVDLVAGCLDARSTRPPERVHHADADEAHRRRGTRAGARSVRTYRGPLHGIPIAVKDLIDVAGTRTTSGSAVPSAPRRRRRAGRHAPAGGRRRPHRQDQPARVRLRHDERRNGVRPGPPPAGPVAIGRRIERRVGGRRSPPGMASGR